MTDTPAVMDERAAASPAVDHVTPVSLAASQGTAIEQSRAVAEAQAAVVLAQHVPRDVSSARAEARRSCERFEMADRAFYKFPRGGSTVRGATVNLARELARCWGNIEYGLTELSRDDRAGQSEMKAWAWDVQTNTRASSTFIVPHRRDRTEKRNGDKVEVQDDLLTLRDVQDNNANIGGRRVRQAIFSILPTWFVEEAEEVCQATLRRGDGRPLEDRITSAVDVFKGLGVELDRIEQKLGRPRDRWSDFDLAELMTSHRSIMRGEVTAAEEFPQRRVTAADIGTDQAAAPAGQEPTAAPPAPQDDPPAAPEADGQEPDWGAMEDELRAALRAKKIKVDTALAQAREMHPKASFGVLADIVRHTEARIDVADWIDQQ